MVAGHIGAAAGAKAFDRRIPFWALLIGSFLLDLLFALFYAFGKEEMSSLPNTDGGYGEQTFRIDWSHSFFGTLILCFVVLVVCARWFRLKGSFVLACVVFSHWFLDVIVHRPDMPIAPGNGGNLPRVGLGLWDAPIASIVLEAVLVIGGAFLWYRTRWWTTNDDRDRQQSSRVPMYAGITLVLGLLSLAFDAMA